MLDATRERVLVARDIVDFPRAEDARDVVDMDLYDPATLVGCRGESGEGFAGVPETRRVLKNPGGCNEEGVFEFKERFFCEAFWESMCCQIGRRASKKGACCVPVSEISVVSFVTVVTRGDAPPILPRNVNVSERLLPKE